MIGELLPLAITVFLLMTEEKDTGGKGTPGQWTELEQNARAAGMSADWIRFLKAWAYHESRGNPRAANRSLGEAASAMAQYVNNRAALARCPYGALAYGWGSGGWYGLLPVSGVWAFKDTPALCEIDPRRTVFDPWESTLEAIDFMRRVMANRDAFKERPIWRILNRATAAPTLMDERPGSSRYERAKQADERFAKALAALGIPASFAEQRVSPLPSGWNAYDLWKGGKQAVA